MAELTEAEIFDRMRTSFAEAEKCCRDLAVLPAKGPTYARLREHLLLIEGCCRQACYWREDARWLPIGFAMNEAHQRAGNWLRAHHPAKLFLLLADGLHKASLVAEMIRTQATGRRGMILPDPIVTHRDTKPLGWNAGLVQ